MVQQKHFTKYSEHFTTPALRAFFPHQYFEDSLQLCSQAEIISGCDMTLRPALSIGIPDLLLAACACVIQNIISQLTGDNLCGSPSA